MAEPGSDCPDQGKWQYATYKDALAAANAAKYRYGWHMRPYRCAWCFWWHLGNRRDENSKSRNTKSRRLRGRR